MGQSPAQSKTTNNKKRKYGEYAGEAGGETHNVEGPTQEMRYLSVQSPITNYMKNGSSKKIRQLNNGASMAKQKNVYPIPVSDNAVEQLLREAEDISSNEKILTKNRHVKHEIHIDHLLDKRFADKDNPLMNYQELDEEIPTSEIIDNH